MRGWFDKTAEPLGSFDETSKPLGWCDADLLGPSGSQAAALVGTANLSIVATAVLTTAITLVGAGTGAHVAGSSIEGRPSG